MTKSDSDSDKIQVVEVKCPRCEYTQIKYIPKEEIGKCPQCGGNMIISEILEEGKSY
jgi:ssDNA-binding Zn-finger/Zn-ribbon topoisomerase 1